VGSSAILLYEAAGGSDDYAMAVKNIPFAFTLEVGNEEYSFDPPPSKIRSLVHETWVGIHAMIDRLMEKYMV
jgi:Zinc carboxypeptidase